MLRSFGAAAALALLGGMLVGCGGSRSTTAPGSAARQSALQDPSVVAVVGDEVITLEEIEDEYAEGRGGRANAAEDSIGAYQEFLERYVNFRLKVAAARAAGLERDSSLQAEADAYRIRMARPYMLEQEVLEPIMQELHVRMKTAVSTSHILIRVAPDASPADTLRAYTKLQAIADSIRNGANFGTLAQRHSEDPSAKMEGRPGYQGNLGVIPPGAAVPEFEDMAYSTPAGQLSPVFRTQFGYHVLRVNDRQPARGDRKMAHILLPYSSMGAPSDTVAAADTLRQIKARVEAGEDFGALARQYSQHSSAQQGGVVDFWFSATPGQGVPADFHAALFGLEEIGDVSGVVYSPMGLHLLQLREEKKLDDYAAMRDELRQAAARSPRAVEAQNSLLERTQREFGYTLDSTVVYASLSSIQPDSLIRILRQGRIPADGAGKVFMTLGDSTYTISELAKFSLRTEVRRDSSTVRMIRPLIDQFVTEATLNYAGYALEDRDPEFRRTMEKFRNGLLLFRIMEDSVWTAASQDSVGLRAYYDAHKSEYWFPTRTRVVSFYADSDSLLGVVRSQVAGGKSAADIQAQFAEDTAVRVDTVFLAGPSNSVYDRAFSLPAGQVSEPVQQGRQFVAVMNAGQEAPRQKTFEEARPEVTTAYQDVLEQRLVQRLKQRHPVRTFPERLSQAYSAERNAAATASGTH